MRFLISLGCLAVLTACSPAKLARHTTGAAEPFLAGRDYFPDKAVVRYAKQFRVSYHGHYKVIDFDPTVPTRERLQYLLVQRGTPVPAGYPGAQIVQIPVSRYIHLHNAYYGLLERFQLVDGLAGIGSINGVTVPPILEGYASGRIREAGSGSHSNIEMAIGLDPEVIFLFYSAYPEYNVHPKLRELGIPAVQLADQFEPTPLGRAEWMKLMALFFNKEAEVNDAFDVIRARYEALAQLAQKATSRPRVLGGAPSSSQWMLFGGRNFQSKLISDAGAAYFWPGDAHQSLLNVSYEIVYDQSNETDRWLASSGMYYPSIDGLIARDRRLAWFRPVQQQRVFAFDRNLDRFRRIPYANYSLDKPDVLLADLIAVFHPELLPVHKFTFLRQVSPAQS
jgi:iron complex transport system substrate-binding protein